MSLAHAFNGTATRVVALWPDVEYTLHEVTNASLSSFGDLEEVRRLGHRLPVAFATGSITLAGTLVCHRSLDGNAPLWKLRRHEGLVRALPSVHGLGKTVADTEGLAVQARHLAQSMLPQELPEVHLLFVTETENGMVGMERLYGVKFQSSGGSIGVDNPLEEDALQFKARFYEQLRLHRHLSREELRGLLTAMSDPNTEHRTAYFNNYHRAPSLVDGIYEVARAYGARDLVEFVNEEAKAYDLAEMTGALGSRLFADRGSVVLLRPSGEEYVPDGVEEVPDDVEEVAVEGDRPHAGVDAEVALAEQVPYADGTVRAATLRVRLKDGGLYLAGEGQEYGGRANAQMSGPTRTLPMSGAGYWELCTGDERGFAHPPDAVRLVVTWYDAEGRLEVRREAEWTDPVRCGVEQGDLSGTYSVPGLGGRVVVYDVDHDRSDHTARITASPYPAELEATVPVGPAGARVQTGRFDATVSAPNDRARLVLRNAAQPLFSTTFEGEAIVQAGVNPISETPTGDGQGVVREYRPLFFGDAGNEASLTVRTHMYDGACRRVDVGAAGPNGSGVFSAEAEGGGARVATPYGDLSVTVAARTSYPWHPERGALVRLTLALRLTAASVERDGTAFCPTRLVGDGVTLVAQAGGGFDGDLLGTAVTGLVPDAPAALPGGVQAWLVYDPAGTSRIDLTLPDLTATATAPAAP